MGFEVLDVGTRQPSPVESAWAGSQSADADVVDLDALPEPPPDDDWRGSEGPSWLRRPTLTLTRGRVALALVAVLVTGLVVGAAWAGRVHDQERAAERSATLAVTALADNWTRVPWTRRPVVDVVVRLVNAGPLPVDVVGSTLGDRPR